MSGLVFVYVDAVNCKTGMKPNVVADLRFRDQVEINCSTLAVELNVTNPATALVVHLDNPAWYRIHLSPSWLIDPVMRDHEVVHNFAQNPLTCALTLTRISIEKTSFEIAPKP